LFLAELVVAFVLLLLLLCTRAFCACSSHACRALWSTGQLSALLLLGSAAVGDTVGCDGGSACDCGDGAAAEAEAEAEAARACCSQASRLLWSTGHLSSSGVAMVLCPYSSRVLGRYCRRVFWSLAMEEAGGRVV